MFGGECWRIKREIRESRICSYDDTGQRVDGINRWPWAFVSKEMVLYLSFDGASGRSRAYAKFVERLQSFVTQKRKWKHQVVKRLAKRVMSVIGTMKILKKDFFTHGKGYILSKLS